MKGINFHMQCLQMHHIPRGSQHSIAPNMHMLYRISSTIRSRSQSTKFNRLVTYATTAPPSAPPPPSPTLSLPRVVLKGGKTRLFTDNQSPIVYGGAIDRVVGRPPPNAGDVVLLCNGADEPFAWGVFNPNSMYRVRILDTLLNTDDSISLDDVVSNRVRAAIAARATLGLLPPPTTATDVYRMVNSEGDRLSGLIVDRLGPGVAVVQSSAVWIESRREMISELIKKHAGVDTVVWRQTSELLKEGGWEVQDQDGEGGGGGEGAFDATPGGSSASAATHVVQENGIKYACNPHGQKTGFYCDQREHRAFIRALAKDKDVVDICCFSGGFTLSAAAGGASTALGIDSSGPAIELARENAKLNGFGEDHQSPQTVSFERADAMQFMRTALSEGKQWDIVVLDPPKLAPNKKSLQNALRRYESLNAVAMQLVRPGGLLMTCSCSGAVAQSGGEFESMLQKASKRARRKVQVVRKGGAAVDHPLDPGYPEGQYLTNITMIVN